MLGKTSWCSIDVSWNNRQIVLFYKKFHFCHLLPVYMYAKYVTIDLMHWRHRAAMLGVKAIALYALVIYDWHISDNCFHE